MRDLQEATENISRSFRSIEESVYYFPSKFFMWLGITLSSISYLDIKESLQFFCIFMGAVSVSLSVILYLLKIWEKRINIKNLMDKGKEEIKKNCKPPTP